MIGASLGFIKRNSISIEKALEELKRLGISAAEISPNHLKDGIPDSIKDFEWVSVHLPKHDYGDNQESERILNILNRLQSVRPIDLAVVHPDPVDDFTPLSKWPFEIGIENMDAEKRNFHFPQEFEDLFSAFGNFKFVLDLNHAYIHDKTLKIADAFYNKFKDRLAEVHISGYEKLHEPLFQTKQVEIMEAVQKPYPPIILEGVGNFEELEKEFSYVSNFFAT